MTAGQVAEWEAFFELEPWGALRDDLRAGTVAAAVANNRGMMSPPRSAIRPSDYFRSLAPARTRPSGTDLGARFRAYTLATGGRVVE